MVTDLVSGSLLGDFGSSQFGIISDSEAIVSPAFSLTTKSLGVSLIKIVSSAVYLSVRICYILSCNY